MTRFGHVLWRAGGQNCISDEKFSRRYKVRDLEKDGEVSVEGVLGRRDIQRDFPTLWAVVCTRMHCGTGNGGTCNNLCNITIILATIPPLAGIGELCSFSASKSSCSWGPACFGSSSYKIYSDWTCTQERQCTCMGAQSWCCPHDCPVSTTSWCKLLFSVNPLVNLHQMRLTVEPYPKIALKGSGPTFPSPGTCASLHHLAHPFLYHFWFFWYNSIMHSAFIL